MADGILGSAADGTAAGAVGEVTPAPASEAPASASMGYRPGPMSRLVAWAERRPWLAAGLYVGLFVVLVAWGHVVEWLLGARPVGTFDARLAALAPYGPFSLAALTLGTRVGRRALVAFWPATGWPESQRAAWNERVQFGRFGPEWLALLVGAAAGVAALLGSPASLLGPDTDRWAIYLAYLPTFLLGYGLAVAGSLTALRWLRTIDRIHREATAVDIFDRGPIYAFSRLTVFASLSYLVAAYYSLAVNGAFQAGNVTSLAMIGATMLLAVVVFTVPMWGIHVRLARVKDELLRDVEHRTNRLAAELYDRIDAGQFDQTAVVNTSLAGLATLRERIARLPTWPWPPQLLRGFVSALLLPLLVFALTRLISGVL